MIKTDSKILDKSIATKKLLKQQKTLFKLFIENTEDYALYLLDSKGLITTWNAGAARIKGYEAEEIIGKHFSTFFTQEDKNKKHPQEILDIAKKEGRYHEQGYRVRKNGSLFWAYIVVTAIYDKKGKLIGFGKITRDLTDLKMVEELLKKQNEELRIAKEAAEAANKAKNTFLSAMSHEIRTPLNSLTGMTDLLLDTQLTKEQREDLEIMRGAEKQLLFVIDNILNFTKVESGAVEFEDVQFKLSKLINSLVNSLTPNAQKNDLKININISNDVPLYLKGDPLRIRQVLNHLLDNAIKFTQQGHIELRIKVAQAFSAETEYTKNNKIHLLFEVIDTGIGINPEIQKKIFNPFVQGDPLMSRKYGGTGLGLAIARKLIEGMNGIFDFESTPNVGSKFWFVVPLIKGEASVAKDMYKAVAKRFNPTEDDKKNFRILLAEDNETNKEVAIRILRKLGYQADTVINGLEVLKALETAEYDLILMDCQMPEMDGYTATKTIRQMEAEQGKNPIPIVAMTAHALIGDEEKCLSIGMNDYITKPINIDRFSKILDGWLSIKLANYPKQN